MTPGHWARLCLLTSSQLGHHHHYPDVISALLGHLIVHCAGELRGSVLLLVDTFFKPSYIVDENNILRSKLYSQLLVSRQEQCSVVTSFIFIFIIGQVWRWFLAEDGSWTVGWFPFFEDFPMKKPHCIAVWINHEKQLKTQVLSVHGEAEVVRGREPGATWLKPQCPPYKSLTEEPMEL